MSAVHQQETDYLLITCALTFHVMICGLSNEIFMSIARNRRLHYNEVHGSNYTTVNQGIFSGFGFYTLISIPV
jgi:hypothetical protein